MMKFKNIPMLFLCAFLLSACRNQSDVRVGGLLSITVKNTEIQDVKSFNNTVKIAFDEGKEWPKKPFTVAQKYTGISMGHTEWVFQGKGDFPNEYKVIVANDNFSDDSVAGQRFDLTLKRPLNEPDTYWTVQTASLSWRCWKGRGHNYYDITPCS